MSGLFDSLADDDGSSIDGKAPPPAKIADWLHGNVSTEDTASIHHRLGTGPSDAASGQHTHRGRDSMFLFSGAEIGPLTDLPASPTTEQIRDAVNRINALLRLVAEP